MSNHPEYAPATILERAAYAVLAAVTGVGLLIAVVAAFQSQLPESLAGQPVVSRALCERPVASPAACEATGLQPPRVVAAR